MGQIGIWIKAFRLRTLPLAFSSIILGSLLAFSEENFKSEIFILSLITTLFLQVLSNLSNDYGDGVKGTDNDKRIGPERAIQSGKISLRSMKFAIGILVFLSLCSGLPLIYLGTKDISFNTSFIFLILGLGAIGAAIKYTVGNNAYGYMGLGDLFVFLFFGVIGVMGTYFLHTGTINLSLLLPSSSIGLLSAAVLNLNNMRDIENDKSSGKYTLAVKLGKRRSKYYHLFLIIAALTCGFTYTILNFDSFYQFLFVICLIPLSLNLKNVFSIENARLLDPELKKVALTTLLFSILFGFGLIF